MTDTMTLTYALDQKLMLKGMTHAGAALQKVGSTKRWWARYAGLFVVSVGASIALRFAEDAFGLQISWPAFVLGMGTAAVIGYVLQRRMVHTMSEVACEAAMRRGPVQLTISAGGLSERSGIGRLDVEWSSIDEIAEIDGAIVVRIGAMCMIIPDSALPEGVGRRTLIEKLCAMQEADTVFG